MAQHLSGPEKPGGWTRYDCCVVRSTKGVLGQTGDLFARMLPPLSSRL